MSRKMVGVILALVGSVVLGVVGGQWFFRLFDKTVPPAVITSFNRTTAHAAFLFDGVLLGVAVFAWVMAVLGLARFFRNPEPPSPTKPGG